MDTHNTTTEQQRRRSQLHEQRAGVELLEAAVASFRYGYIHAIWGNNFRAG